MDIYLKHIKNKILMFSAHFEIKLSKIERLEPELFNFKSEHIKKTPCILKNYEV